MIKTKYRKHDNVDNACDYDNDTGNQPILALLFPILCNRSMGHFHVLNYHGDMFWLQPSQELKLVHQI